eukprot:scaffold25100_cov68-Phaeocystis_antarctica.AAC.10
MGAPWAVSGSPSACMHTSRHSNTQHRSVAAPGPARNSRREKKPERLPKTEATGVASYAPPSIASCVCVKGGRRFLQAFALC